MFKFWRSRCGFRQLLLVCLIIFLPIFYLFDKIKRSQADSSIIEGWGPNVSRDASIYVRPDKNTTLIVPKRLCQQYKSLLVIVCSSSSNFERRNVIRETWGLVTHVSDFNIDVYFLLGLSSNSSIQKEVELEYSTYDDVIQEDFVDSYNNLTIKSLMMLKLVKSNCVLKFRYLMKTDDDTYVNFLPLVNHLKTTETENLLMGYLYKTPAVIKNSYSKWNGPSYLFNEEYYPSFLSGSAYVMSADVAFRLYEVSFLTPIFYLEDVYITGILPERLHIDRRHNWGFSGHKVKIGPCNSRKLITSHMVSVEEMQKQNLLLQNSDLELLCKRRRYYDFNIFNIL